MQELDPVSFEQGIWAPALTMVYFYGPECPNCDVFAADWPTLMPRLEDKPLRCFKLNAYQHTGLATRYGLYGVPNFLFFQHGRLLGKMSQYYGKTEFLDIIDQMTAKYGRSPSATLSGPPR